MKNYKFFAENIDNLCQDIQPGRFKCAKHTTNDVTKNGTPHKTVQTLFVSGSK